MTSTPSDTPPAAGPRRVRPWLLTTFKVLVTGAAFYLLLTHRLPDGQGGTLSTWEAISDHLLRLDAGTFWPFLLAGTAVKGLGILSSMTRWWLLLRDQGLRFGFWYLAGSFLIGRFLGTFLPSTVGLDGYKLYDAARGSGRLVEAAAATAIEKVLGLSGIFVTFLIAFPLGGEVLGAHRALAGAVSVPLAAALVGAVALALILPAPLVWLLRHLPLPRRARLASILERLTEAARVYRGRPGRVALLLALSTSVHFCTAALYYLTALAVGAQAPFWRVILGSTIQIVATVLSPFTIAGEGVREIVQALLLARELGVGASILSAALGFWAAEALTLLGGFIWLARRRPARVLAQEAGHAEHG